VARFGVERMVEDYLDAYALVLGRPARPRADDGLQR
jgi:hypothetical protein